MSVANALLLELEYGATVRPVDLGINADERELAIGLQQITLACITTGRLLGDFDFKGRHPTGSDILYGLAGVEPWGVWSVGPRTAMVLTLNAKPVNRIHVDIHHRVVENSLPLVRARLRLNKASPADVEFRGGICTCAIAATRTFEGAPDQAAQHGSPWRH